MNLDLDILPLYHHAKSQIRMHVHLAARVVTDRHMMSEPLHRHVTDVGCENYWM